MNMYALPRAAQTARRCVFFALVTAATLGPAPAARAEDAAVTNDAQPASVTNAEAAVGAQADEKVVKGVSFMERLQQGGYTMFFLLFASVVAVTFSIERAVHLRRKAVYPDGLAEQADELWSRRRYDDIYALCDRYPSTLATIIRAFVRHRNCPSSELSVLAGDIAGRDMRAHLQKAYPIAVAATVSPLLGLFGTVIGMIEAFEIVAIAGSLGDASLLAGSISKALVTTAAGLVIAIPALSAYHFFKSRTNSLAMGLEGVVNELLSTWFMDKADDTAERARQ